MLPSRLMKLRSNLPRARASVRRGDAPGQQATGTSWRQRGLVTSGLMT